MAKKAKPKKIRNPMEAALGKDIKDQKKKKGFQWDYRF